MHEYSIAEGIILAIKKIRDYNNLSIVSEADILVGDLAQIDKEVLLELLNILSEEYGLGRITFSIKEEESKFECNQCGFSWSWSQIRDSIMGELCGGVEDCDNPVHFIPDLINVFMVCPRCKSQDFKIVSGYDVRLLSVKGVKSD
ncbi:MAG: hydrogenase/urease maturation nickel metallochaperone HypA [Sulfolobales archaeon]